MNIFTGIQECLASNIANVKNIAYSVWILKHCVQTVKIKMLKKSEILLFWKDCFSLSFQEPPDVKVIWT